MNKKIATEIALGTILIIAIVVGGAVWFSGNQKAQAPAPTVKTTQPAPQTAVTDETAGWQTYRNEKYGFEFQYPNTLKVSGQGTNEMKVFSVAFEGNNENITLVVEDNPELWDAVKIKEKYHFGFNEGDGYVYDFVDVAGINSLRRQDNQKTSEEYFIPRGNKLFKVGFSFPDQKSIPNKILSTLKFTK